MVFRGDRPHSGEIWGLASVHFDPLFLEIQLTDFGIFNLIDSTYSLLSILSCVTQINFVEIWKKNAKSHFSVFERRKYSKSRCRYTHPFNGPLSGTTRTKGRYDSLMLKFSPGGAVTVRDRPHKVYEVEQEVGVAESEKLVSAIFLLPVWLLEPPGRSFLPYSGLFCPRIACKWLEMLSIRKPGAPNLNLWPRSTIHKPEVLSKVPEMVRNVVKLAVIRKTHVKSRRGQT